MLCDSLKFNASWHLFQFKRIELERFPHPFDKIYIFRMLSLNFENETIVRIGTCYDTCPFFLISTEEVTTKSYKFIVEKLKISLPKFVIHVHYYCKHDL